MTNITYTNNAVSHIDIQKFSGKWYSLYSIPTLMDKNWRQTTETYTLEKAGMYKVATHYKKEHNDELKKIFSKLFFDEQNPNGEMQAQFIWPFKVDYLIIEIASDYSYVVVGHPKQKYLFIMSRKPYIDNELLHDIIARCKVKGYDVDKLVSQEHS